jgi:geranylgeranyl transferase type-2 subunit beta
MAPPPPPPLQGELHVAFVRRSAEERGSMEAVASEHLRLSGVYWGLACCALLRAPADALGDRAALAAWVRACGVRCGDGGSALGFAPAPGHDPHLLYTLSALQVLALLGTLGDVDADAVAAYVAGALSNALAPTPRRVAASDALTLRRGATLRRRAAAPGR